MTDSLDDYEDRDEAERAEMGHAAKVKWQREFAAKLQRANVASTNFVHAVTAVLQHDHVGAPCYVSPALGASEIKAAEKLLVDHKKSLKSQYVQLRLVRLAANVDRYDVPARLQDIENEVSAVRFCLVTLGRLARQEDFIPADDVGIAALTGLDEAELHDYLDRLGTRFRLLCEQIWDLDDHADLSDMEDCLGRIH